MSRIGKLPVPLTDGAKAKVSDLHIEISGPKGTISKTFKGDLEISNSDSEVTVKLKNPDNSTKFDRCIFGTARSIISNMVTGVTKGYSTSLSIVGVGYRAFEMTGGINLSYGFSHKIKFFIAPEHLSSIKISVPKQDNIIVSGIDKELVGLYVSKLLNLRPYNIYKGKGISITGVKMMTKKAKAKK